MGSCSDPLPIPGGGYSWEFLAWVCHPVLQILTLFQTKKCNFPDPFTDHTSKNPYSFPDLAFRHTLFPDPENGAKTLPDGAAHTYITFLREYPPPPRVPTTVV